jgi:pyruvate dehydrogenase E1 component alpha subunit
VADLPDASTCYELLARMALIRRFEEEAGRQYQRAKAGGFLHLAIGEEATIVGTASVMHEEDYLIGTYRTHGHAIARGTEPKRVMAELFGRVDGTSGGRGGSMHIFDREHRDRRRQPADRGRPRSRLRVQGRGRSHRLHVRRRRL